MQDNGIGIERQTTQPCFLWLSLTGQTS